MKTTKKSKSDKIAESFDVWWRDEGSAMRPNADEDAEEFAKRITRIAWSNGIYKRNENS